MKRSFLFLLVFAFSGNVLFSQSPREYGDFAAGADRKKEKKMLKQARKYFDAGEYTAAAAAYGELLKLDSANPMYNYEMAECYYNNFRQPASIPYFSRSIQFSKDTMGEAFFFLAVAQHLDRRFDDAQKNYSHYLRMIRFFGTSLPTEEEEKLLADIRRRMEMCENGKQLSLDPATTLSFKGQVRPFEIKDAGTGVNSDFDDYDPILSGNDSLMYFTTRRETTTGERVDWDDKYFEDIFLSVGKMGEWGSGAGIGEPVNTDKHEAVISLSADGQTLYFYRGIKQGTFYASSRQSGTWSDPVVLYEGSDINTKSWETSLFGFTLAGNELYVVSDREGTLGGRDIFVSRKQPDGKWGPLVNMGPVINTPYDEDAPFLSSDGTTLYFSSTGHNSMGGFDLFTSRRDADAWSRPQNMGVPFSTPGDDIYFILANTSDRAYFSSSAFANDGTRDLDIYQVNICDLSPKIQLAGKTSGFREGSLWIAGAGADTLKVEIRDEKFNVDLESGKKYMFLFRTEGIEPVKAEFEMPRICHSTGMFQEIEFRSAGQDMAFKNAFFDIRKVSGGTDYSGFLAATDRSKLAGYKEYFLPTVPMVISSPTAVVTGTPTIVATPTTVVTTTVTAAEPPLLTLGNQMFDYDRADVKDEFKSELDRLAEYLLKSNRKAMIEIGGHTDSRGSEEYNLNLSKRRADSIIRYLASKGVPRSRMHSVGYGESRPLVADVKPDGSDDPDARAKNRRTEINFIQ